MHQFGGPEPDNYPMMERIARERRVATEPSVNDIPDNVLLQRVLRYLATRGRKREKDPLWSIVSDHFALGSGYSAQLCRRFGLDPDQIVRK